MRQGQSPDEPSVTGEGEATQSMKANHDQTVTALAYIARTGAPISPINNLVIKVPSK